MAANTEERDDEFRWDCIGLLRSILAAITDYKLNENFTNPFNPTTVINYQIPKAGRVTLRIYDMLGKEVVKLVDEEKSAGQYHAEFNASRLASGVYFYQIECNDFKAVKKKSFIK